MAREQARAAAKDQAIDGAIRSGKSLGEAEAAGKAAAEAALVGKDATHSLDWVAGGDGRISGLGDSKTNRSVGSQWNKKSPGAKASRREQLRKAAQAAKDAGQKKMDVKLKKC